MDCLSGLVRLAGAAAAPMTAGSSAAWIVVASTNARPTTPHQPAATTAMRFISIIETLPPLRNTGPDNGTFAGTCQ